MGFREELLMQKRVFDSRLQESQSAKADQYWLFRCAEERRASSENSFPVDISKMLKNLPWADQEVLNEVSKKRLDGIKTKSFKNHLKGHKLSVGNLSPGCRICIKGKWSCLFLNKTCTAKCFFCPIYREAKQFSPLAENIRFSGPEQYVSYLKQFQFQGMSFSGGEPLLEFEKVLIYLKLIRRMLPQSFYIWLYTNGDLFSHEKLQILRGEGVNEIRIDLAASGFQLERLKLAGKYFKTMTVEIPMIPEQLKTLKKLVPRFVECGVRHLNLHQLVLTPFNEASLRKRKYHYLKGPQFSSVESELAAIDLLTFIKENKFPISAQYCSASFKEEFQSQYARRRWIPSRKNNLPVTEKGFLREYGKNGSLIYWEPTLCENSREPKLEPVARFTLSSKPMVKTFEDVFVKKRMDLISAMEKNFKRNNPEIMDLFMISEIENIRTI